jgi:hypothetical protein
MLESSCMVANVLLVEGIRSAGEHLKYAQGPAKVTQWGNQNRPHSQASATRQIDARIVLRVMAKHYLSGSNAVCGNAGISLQPDTKIGRGTSSARTADNLVSVTERDSCSRGSG